MKFAIADTRGKVGSAEQTLIVPPIVPGNLTASSLILAEKPDRLPPLIQDLELKLLGESDPMIFKGLQIVPSVDYQVSASAAASVIFRLHKLKVLKSFEQIRGRLGAEGFGERFLPA